MTSVGKPPEGPQVPRDAGFFKTPGAAQVAKVSAEMGQREGTLTPEVIERYKKAATRHLITTNLGDVEMEGIDWIWPGWIPRRYITLFVGETGGGKGTTIADIVSRITTGAPWPGETEQRAPGNVIWIGSEDGISDMLKPRIVACGGDPTRISVVRGALQNGERSTFSLQDDVIAVMDWLKKARDEKNPYTLAVVDPITSYLAGGKLKRADFKDATHMRSILEPWHDVTQEFDMGLAGVTHLAKDTARSILHRVLGSGAFAQTCRSLPAIVARPEEGRYARAMVQIKTNLPEQPEGAWMFTTEVKELGTDKRGKVIKASHPVWDRIDSNVTPENVIGKSSSGPISNDERPELFQVFLYDRFFGKATDEWVPLSPLKQRALEQKIVSAKWWEENSMKYLEKWNDSGDWKCRRRFEVTE